MAAISFFTEDTTFILKNKNNIRSWISNCIRNEKCKPGDLTFIFCSDAHLLEINKKFLDHDYFTDIITFDYTFSLSSEGSKQISGDIFISIDRVSENASLFGGSFADELHRVIIHGVLHLIGFKDKSSEEKEVMTGKENYYLSLRNFS